MTAQESKNIQPATAPTFPSVIWGSAIEAAWKTIVLLVLGNIAIGLVSDIFHDMTPSLPPGFANSEATTHAQHHWHSWGWLHRSPFYPVFALMFGGILWSRLRGPVAAQTDTRSKRLQRIQEALRENWFGLIVGNAFGAMITVIVAIWVQRFSSVQWVWHSLVHSLLQLVLSERALQGINSWLDWFGQNQPKFDFWMIYFAAICDDLGIPNIKTFGRWLWRKVRKEMRAAELKVES